MPGPLLGTRVAIVGAGLAGIVAAYELFRAGLNPVIYEATGRIGGRTFSQPFGNSSSKDAPIAELGAMRVPTSCKVFYYYAGYLRGHSALSGASSRHVGKRLLSGSDPDPGQVLRVGTRARHGYSARFPGCLRTSSKRRVRPAEAVRPSMACATVCHGFRETAPRLATNGQTEGKADRD